MDEGSKTNRRRVIIDLDLDGAAIAGELSGASGPATPFSGWLGLAEALEEALGLAGEAAARIDPLPAPDAAQP